MKKKILVVTSTYRSEDANNFPGFVNELCERLSENFSIEVLTQHRPGLDIKEVVNGIPVRRFRYAPERLEVLSESGGINNTLKEKPWTIALIPLFIIGQIISLWKAIKRFNPDIIHAHWIIPQGLTAVIARKLNGNKPAIVLTSHGGDLYGLQGKLSGYLKQFVLNNCDRICVVSSPMREAVINDYGIAENLVEVSPMGASLDSTFTPDTRTYRNPGSLIFAGRLVEKKGVIYVLDALIEIVDKVPNANLTIVGDGPLRSNLEETVKQLGLSRHVTFLGSVSHSDLANLYRASEIAIFPFVQADNGDMEGLGLVVIEAMGCATAVIVGDVPAIHDVVLNNVTGLISNPKDRTAFSQQIISLLNNPVERKNLGQTGRSYTENNFSWSICAERYKLIFNNIEPRLVTKRTS